MLGPNFFLFFSPFFLFGFWTKALEKCESQRIFASCIVHITSAYFRKLENREKYHNEYDGDANNLFKRRGELANCTRNQFQSKASRYELHIGMMQKLYERANGIFFIYRVYSVRYVWCVHPCTICSFFVVGSPFSLFYSQFLFCVCVCVCALFHPPPFPPSCSLIRVNKWTRQILSSSQNRYYLNISELLTCSCNSLCVCMFLFCSVCSTPMIPSPSVFQLVSFFYFGESLFAWAHHNVLLLHVALECSTIQSNRLVFAIHATTNVHYSPCRLLDVTQFLCHHWRWRRRHRRCRFCIDVFALASFVVFGLYVWAHMLAFCEPFRGPNGRHPFQYCHRCQFA